MKTKEIYKENKKRKYCPIVEIKNEGIGLESKPILSIKNNWIKYTIGTLIVVLILVFTFYKDVNALTIVLALAAFVVLACIFSGSYSIKCKEKTLALRINFQKIELSYSRIVNIFISKEISAADLLPMLNYNLVIRYVDNINIMREIYFSTLFLKSEDIHKFLDNFVIQEEKDDQCIKFEKYKTGKLILKYMGIALVFILIGLYVFFSLR